MTICSLKDRDYLSTINRIKKILYENDINIKEITEESSGIYYTRLTTIYSFIGSNGKGFSKEQSIASAYGELIERISNNSLIKFLQPLDNESKNKYVYLPDEIKISTTKANKQIEALNQLTEEVTSKWMSLHTNNEILKNYYLAIPYKNLMTQKEMIIPGKLCEHIYASNGMCAGNTFEEAIVQGISEVFERYVNKKFIFNKITPPNLPESLVNKNEHAKRFISRIKVEYPELEVLFTDCSLGEGMPVVGLFVIDKKSGKYFVKFGAHPVLNIAMNRCISELLQGRCFIDKDDWFRGFRFTEKSDLDINFINIFRNGQGDYPYEIFLNDSSYEFSNIWYEGEMKNVLVLDYIVSLLIKNDIEVYYKNTSYLGFDSYQVIIPKYSEIINFNDDYVNRIFDYERIKGLLKKVKNCNKNEIRDIVNYIERYQFNTNEYNLSDVLCIKMSSSSLFYRNSVLLFLFYSYILFEEYDKAIFYIKELNSSTKKHNSLYSCLYIFSNLLFNKKESIEIANEVIEKLFELQIAKYVKTTVIKPEIYFNIFPVINCYSCDNCTQKKECYYPIIKKFNDKITNNLRGKNEEM